MNKIRIIAFLGLLLLFSGTCLYSQNDTLRGAITIKKNTDYDGPVIRRITRLEEVSKGAEFICEVKLTIYTEKLKDYSSGHFLRVMEEIPEGYRLISYGDAGSRFAFMKNTVNFMWGNGEIPEGNTIEVWYTLGISLEAHPKPLSIKGKINYLSDFDERITLDIIGDNEFFNELKGFEDGATP